MIDQRLKDAKIHDPWGNYWFSFHLDGLEVAHFREISGLKTTSQVFEIEEGGYNGHVHRKVGQSSWDNVILKQATNVSTALMDWRDRYQQDQFDSRAKTSATIIQYNNAGKELRRYDLVAVWPVSWEGPQLDSGASGEAIETIEIAHEGLSINGKPKPTPVVKKPVVPKNFAPDTIQFKKGSSELTPEGYATIDKISDSIDDVPDQKHFWVEGHTSDEWFGVRGHPVSLAKNTELSIRRAGVVAAELRIRQPSKTFESAGYGFQHPVASNEGETGRIANRRTDVMNVPPPGGRNWKPYEPPSS